MRNFQIIIIIIFIAAAVLGVLVFSGVIPLGDKESKVGSLGTVVLWGTMKSSAFSSALDDFNRANSTFIVKYVQKDPETFDNDLLEALASGIGPDMFFLPDDLAFHYKSRIYTIPYQSFPVANFRNNFASAGEIFLTSKGILAFPISIDPMVMYYNRSILDSNSIVYPPKYWNELQDIVSTLTKKDDGNKIIKSAVAFGQFSNINNAKDIISMLFMQAGNKMINENSDGYYSSVMDGTGAKYDMGSVFKFYTEFANPLGLYYSWNKSLPNSLDFFSAENLAFYFGYGSEFESLVNKNPNQNFLAAPVPQIKNLDSKLTYGKVTGIAISSFSKNLNTAITAASLMVTSDFASKYASALNVVPARRDLLSQKPTDAFFPIFYDSALYAKAWLDPSPSDTNDIFRLMVEKTLSNNMSAGEAVKDASDKLQLLLLK